MAEFIPEIFGKDRRWEKIVFKMADTVRERLERRNEERLAEREKRKAERDTQAQPDENKDYFISNFSKEEKEIEEMLEKCNVLKPSDKAALSQHFDEMSSKCYQLQKLLADATLFLPSYDVKRKQGKVSCLQQAITEKREELLPKKKFAFKARQRKTQHSTGYPQGDNPVPVTASKTDKFLETSCGVKDLADQALTLKHSQVASKDVALENLQQCVVEIYGPPSALHVNKLKDCKVFCGPVSGSVFIDNCQNCTFVLPCHQLRVHTTRDSQFYLHVTSRAIIEDCHNIGFAPFNWTYVDLEEDFTSSGLCRSENNWSLVNDFNWLKTDEQSPNWYIVDEDSRISNWN